MIRCRCRKPRWTGFNRYLRIKCRWCRKRDAMTERLEREIEEWRAAA